MVSGREQRGHGARPPWTVTERPMGDQLGLGCVGGQRLSTSHPPLGCVFAGPLEPVPICFLLFFDRKLQESWPHPHYVPALPLSSPLWTEPPWSGCLPATSPADMGNVGAVQLCCAILGFLLLQGKRRQALSFRDSSPGAGALADYFLRTGPHIHTQRHTQPAHPGLYPRGRNFRF